VRYEVRGGDGFWKDLRDLNDLRIFGEVTNVAIRLVESPDLPEAREQDFPLGEVVAHGRAVDLESGDGFIVYFRPEDLNHSYIYLAALVMYDWYFDDRA
jgi:hypothetical protein